jgi:hypothetical protein
MTIASGSRHGLAYVAETDYGVTPATPALQRLRHNSTSLGLSKETLESEELRSDRQRVNVKHGNRSVAGDLAFELSYASFDDFIEAALCGTWDTNVLKAGTARRSFTVERHFSDISQYLRYAGCEINTLSLSVAPNAMVTGSFGLIGKGQTVDSAEITDATYVDANSNTPFDSFTGSITEGGAAIAVVTSLELSIENGLEALYVIGSPETLRPSIGRSTIGGSISAYFEDASLINKFIDETASSISFTLTDTAGNSYIVNLPNVKYNTGAPELSGQGPVTVSLDFAALYDATEASNIVITRVPA